MSPIMARIFFIFLRETSAGAGLLNSKRSLLVSRIFENKAHHFLSLRRSSPHFMGAPPILSTKLYPAPNVTLSDGLRGCGAPKWSKTGNYARNLRDGDAMKTIKIEPSLRIAKYGRTGVRKKIALSAAANVRPFGSEEKE